jgi:hypothetical protein
MSDSDMQLANEEVITKLSKNAWQMRTLETRRTKLTKEKLELIRDFKFQCKKCGKIAPLKELTFIERYELDMDSDAQYYPPKQCEIRCSCGYDNYLVREEILAGLIENSFSYSAVFKKTLTKNASRC